MERIRRVVKSMLKYLKDSRGVSLYEITAAVAMTGILAAVAVPVVIDKVTEAKIAATLQVTDTIYKAMSQFQKDTGKWPGEAEGVAVLLSSTDSSTVPLPGGGGTEIVGAFCKANSAKCADFNKYLVDNPGPNYQNWQGPYTGGNIIQDSFDRAIVVNVQALTIAEAADGTTIVSGKPSCGFAWVLSGGPDRFLNTTFFVSSIDSTKFDDIGKNNGKKSPPGVGCK